MIIRAEEGTLDISARVFEAQSNNEACEYLASNYNKLQKIVAKCGIHPNKCDDLLQDVWISLATNEMDGEGFDMNYANSKRSIMDVSQFVIGRIKLYAKNEKYRSDISESGITNTFSKSKSKGSKFIKNKVKVSVCAASFDESDLENNDPFQKGYAMASIVDSTDDLVEGYSLREQIDYCIDIAETANLDLMHLFRNIDELAGLLGMSDRRGKTETVFSSITQLVDKHSDFAEALLGVLTFSARNRAAYELVLDSYC